MNRTQRKIGIIFAVIILIASLIAFEDSSVAGIIGLSVSAGLFIYCFSGKPLENKRIINFKSIFKSRGFRIVLIFVILVSLGIIVSLILVYQIEQREQQERLEALKNIKIVSSEIDPAESHWGRTYLYLTIKNNGQKSVGDLRMQISYYDDAKYLIKRSEVNTPRGEWIPAGEQRKYKIRLWGYPYPQKVSRFKIEVISCVKKPTIDFRPEPPF